VFALDEWGKSSNKKRVDMHTWRSFLFHQYATLDFASSLVHFRAVK
jgi:hypothetical protein